MLEPNHTLVIAHLLNRHKEEEPAIQTTMKLNPLSVQVYKPKHSLVY